MRPQTAIIALGLAVIAAFFLRRTFESGYSQEFVDMNSEQNLAAFLKLIRQAESADDYYALVGGGQFIGTTDHPALTGEFAGIRMPDGRLTTAAGAYQITRTTWKDLGGAERYGDFLPRSQDIAAVDLIKRRGALDDVTQGRFDVAVTKLRNEWEAFARMLAGNYPITLTDAKAIYLNAGGTVA